ncbi:MAG: DNA-directed RNA polymerase subunit beta', partial [Lachnospiraceae bacterium]|nr:DNA-directed RNA polymerase subunit beta' [Lachnospiraceae bacterium]
PERDGLFCEKIFGPTKDWECACGKYKRIKNKGVVCDRCGVEVTKASVRRERMGHIELAAPVSHIWYFKGIPSRMGLILDLSPRVLERVLYFAAYIVLDPKDTPLTFKQILNEAEYQEARTNHGEGFRVGMGAEAVWELLAGVDLDKEYETLSDELGTATGQKRARIIKRLEVVEAFRESGNKPEWMVMNVIPVIPPDLRPMVQLDGGRFATSDLNDLYRRIINRNNRLRRLLDLGAPEIIVRNEKRMLQEAVDALIDNGRRGRAVTGPGNRALKSLSDMLKGKSGRFRQNLLGKRVDYSGRSVIVVGPELKIYQCGLPKEMAIELFKPFVMKELVTNRKAHNIKSAKKMVEKLQPEVWDVLEDVIKEHPVMLNRAPTLHRLGIQAFEPILVEGKAIKLHPLVCTAYNADFDGDQMAAHLPLTAEAQAECRFMLLSPNNLLKPSDGGVVAVPSQDMVLGIYYMTQLRPGAKGEYKVYYEIEEKDPVTGETHLVEKPLAEGESKEGKRISRIEGYYRNLREAILAHENGFLSLHAKIKVRVEKETAEGKKTANVESTLGRFLFNEVIPQDLGFVDRSIEEDALKLEVERHVKKRDLKEILEKIIDKHGATKTAEVLDDIKSMGYKYSTLAAMTVSISDMTVPEQKQQLIQEAEDKVEKIKKHFQRGYITEEERYSQTISTWNMMDDELTKDLMDGLDEYNNIFMMADSGARGSNAQIKQLAGMRGLMADTTGRTIELPIKSNFREGLDVLEYFMSAHGARKGLSDTALRTADSGYLTRRLVDVSQELIIRERDCVEGKGVELPGMYVSRFVYGNNEVIEDLKERIKGRFACEDIYDEKGERIVKANHLITPSRAERIIEFGVDKDGKKIEKVKIRNVLNCRCKNGICAKCYGSNMATGQAVQVGEAVGIIAAQSIGEPGTQLTMRTFHTGGVAGSDITQGLPRVEELFEARKPKGLAIITEIAGRADIRDSKKKREIVVTNMEGEAKTYLIPYGSHIKIADGVMLEAGDELTEGSVNPHDIIRIKGIRAVQDYILREVQRVYRLQGVDINDKHIEIIVRQMMRKVRIENAGDSDFLPGAQVDFLEFEETNQRLAEEGREQAEGERVLLGITKASLATNSFMSAASFQETTKVLTDAAIKGKIDPLNGLKENVIIGKLIPAGTGMKRYSDIRLNTDYEERIQNELEQQEMLERELTRLGAEPVGLTTLD